MSISEIIQKLPIVVDDTFVPDIHRELISNNTWVCLGLKSCATFAWGLTLRALSQYPSIQGKRLTAATLEITLAEIIMKIEKKFLIEKYI